MGEISGYFSLTNVVRAGVKYNLVTGWLYTRPVRTYFQRHENARTAGAIGAGAADYYIGGGTPVFSSAYAFYIADITGGDPWEAAVVAGATSYASYGVGGTTWAWYTKVFWYGVIGGTVSKHYGGEFEQGFKAAAAGSAVGMGLNARGAYPAISASVAGGVSAELGGGKFKNGAATGAFAYAVSGMFAEAGRPDTVTADSDKSKFKVKYHDDALVTDNMKERLQAFAEHIGKDVDVYSGVRDCSSTVGSGCTSQHALGDAADISAKGQLHIKTYHQAVKSNMFGGVGWYEEGYRGLNGEGPHVHVDLRNNPASWGYDSSGQYYNWRNPVPDFN